MAKKLMSVFLWTMKRYVLIFATVCLYLI